MHCELVPLEEFLSIDAKICSDYNLFPVSNSGKDMWKELTDAIIPTSTEDVIVSDDGYFQPFTTQTQNQILLNWRSEFETPVIPRVSKVLVTSPKTPILFNDDDMLDFDELEEDELCFPSQRVVSSLSQNNILSSSLMEEATFTTAGGKTLPPPSPASRKRANDVLKGQYENQPEPAVSFVGFSTASGKKIASPSKEAKGKADALMRSIPIDGSTMLEAVPEKSSMNTDFSTTTPNGRTDDLLEGFIVEDKFELSDKATSAVSKSVCLTFSTASGKRIKSPSKEAVQKVKELISDIQTEKAPSFPSFSTASGKKVQSPSSKALEVAEKTLCELKGDHSYTPQHGKLQFLSSPGQSFSTPTTAKTPVSGSKDMRHNGFKPFKPHTTIDPLKSITMQTPRRSSFLEKLTASPLQVKVDVIDSTLRTVFNLDRRSPFLRQRLSQFSSLVRRSTNTPLQLKIDGDQVKVAISSHGIRVPDKWFENHFLLVLWKLSAYSRLEIPIDSKSLDRWCINQLLYRYEREINHAQRSILKKIVERDDSPAAQMILFVSSIERSHDQTVLVSVSDGWYSVKIVQDVCIERLIDHGLLGVGQKIRIAMAQVISEEACDILDANEKNVKLKISGNAVRPARWHAMLGKQKCPMFTVSLASLDVDGGPTACVQVVIQRRYPCIYAVEWESGKRKSLVQEEFAELETNEDARNEADPIVSVRMSVKIKVLDCCGAPRKGYAIITLWDSAPETYSKLIEGAQLKVSIISLKFLNPASLWPSSRRFVKRISCTCRRIGRQGWFL